MIFLKQKKNEGRETSLTISITGLPKFFLQSPQKLLKKLLQVKHIWKLNLFILKLVDTSSFQKKKKILYFLKIDNYDNENGGFEH